MIPEFTDEASFADLLEPAMEIAHRGDHEEAKAYLEAYVAYLQSTGRTLAQAVDIAKTNVGYYAGYHGYETMQAVSRVFGADHPVFGGPDRYGRERPAPTAEEAFDAGMRMAAERGGLAGEKDRR